MKLLPTSLAGRTVLLVVVVIAVAEVATFSLIGYFRRTAHLDQTVKLIVSQVRLLQLVLPRLDADSRRLLAAADAGEQGLQLRSQGSSVPPHQPAFPFARRLAFELNDRLGEPIVLRHGGPGQRSGLWIGFRAGDERWWLILPPPRFHPQELPVDLWAGLAVTLAVVLLVAGLFVRGIVRPLARLGEAVTATGDGSARKVVPEGPREVQQLAERHNTMLEQLAAAAMERREMLAGLTHDLRAPLARLRLRLELLESERERAGLTRDIDDMTRIVGQCLAFLRSDTVERSKEVLAIAALLRQHLARHRDLGRDVQLTVRPDAEGCRVALSDGNLQRILDNLLGNAFVHGQPPVEIALQMASPSRVALSVRDHGPGIADPDCRRALEPFTQLDPARATDGSCGLGLAIVRRIAAGCGGEVQLASAVGGGLEVTVHLPVC